MESQSLKLKIIDAIKIQLKISWLPVIAGLALAYFLGYAEISALIFEALPIMTIICVIVAFVRAESPYGTLTKDGFLYKNQKSEEMLCLWNMPIEINSKRVKYPQSYAIKDIEKNYTFYVPIYVFSYPEVSELIRKYSPPDHKLRELIQNNP